MSDIILKWNYFNNAVCKIALNFIGFNIWKQVIHILMGTYTVKITNTGGLLLLSYAVICKEKGQLCHERGRYAYSAIIIYYY